MSGPSSTSPGLLTVLADQVENFGGNQQKENSFAVPQLPLSVSPVKMSPRKKKSLFQSPEKLLDSPKKEFEAFSPLQEGSQRSQRTRNRRDRDRLDPVSLEQLMDVGLVEIGDELDLLGAKATVVKEGWLEYMKDKTTMEGFVASAVKKSKLEGDERKKMGTLGKVVYEKVVVNDGDNLWDISERFNEKSFKVGEDSSPRGTSSNNKKNNNNNNNTNHSHSEDQDVQLSFGERDEEDFFVEIVEQKAEEEEDEEEEEDDEELGDMSTQLPATQLPGEDLLDKMLLKKSVEKSQKRSLKSVAKREIIVLDGSSEDKGTPIMKIRKKSKNGSQSSQKGPLYKLWGKTETSPKTDSMIQELEAARKDLELDKQLIARRERKEKAVFVSPDTPSRFLKDVGKKVQKEEKKKERQVIDILDDIDDDDDDANVCVTTGGGGDQGNQKKRGFSFDILDDDEEEEQKGERSNNNDNEEQEELLISSLLYKQGLEKKPKVEEKKIKTPELSVKTASTISRSNSSIAKSLVNSPVTLTSGLKQIQRSLCSNACDTIGGSLAEQWDNQVTHVIVKTDEGSGKCYRTVKFVLAVLSGTYVVSMKWIQESLKAQMWVDETPFLVEDNSGFEGCAVKMSLDRHRNYQPLLFEGLRFFFFGKFNGSVQKAELEHIAEVGGAVVLLDEPKAHEINEKTMIITSAEMSVAEGDIIWRRCGRDAISSNWMLDCVSAFQILPTRSNMKYKKTFHEDVVKNSNIQLQTQNSPII